MNGTPPNQNTPPAEDAGSQALSEALRSSFFIVKIVMAFLVVAFLSSGIFTVKPQERAIVLRLGRPVGEGEQALLKPGFHWGFPPPIDEVVRIQFTAFQSADSSLGWHQTADERRRSVPGTPLMQLSPETTSYDISADTNIIHLWATVRYHITEPTHFYFDFTDAAVFVTNALDNALLSTARQFTVDDILTKNREGFREAVSQRLRDLVASEHLGITLDSQLGLDVSAPISLVEKFNAVDAANARRDNARSQAESYATKTLAESRSTAASRVYMAESARSAAVAIIEADAEKFSKLKAEYERNPDFYERLRQMIVLQQVYKNAQEKIIDVHLNQSQLRLNLSREPQAPSTNAFVQ